MKRILVLCGSNSCRSQMAEGYLRFYAWQWAQVESAGVQAGNVHPLTVLAMEEDSIDISRQISKACEKFQGQSFDFLITLCDEARDNLPTGLSFDQHLHFDIPDPATPTGNREQQLSKFRQIRELVKKQMLRLIGGRLMEREEEYSPAV